MKFHFVVSNKSGSSQMRGYQVAEALGGTVGHGPAHADVLVFVKDLPHVSVLDEVRKVARFVIYDPVDNFCFTAMQGKRFHAVIAANGAHALRLSRVFRGVRVQEIPHHHCILNGVGALNAVPPARLGYVGEPNNLGISEEILKRRFPRFLIGNDIGLLKQIGVGIAFRPPGEGRSYKSGVKLANYWAHGIAAICSADTSYIEMAAMAHDESVSTPPCLFAQTSKEALDMAEWLLSDEQQRKNIATAGHQEAWRYDLARLASEYRSLVSALVSDY